MGVDGHPGSDVVWKTSDGGTNDWWGAFRATWNAALITGQYAENAIANYRKLTISLRSRAVFANMNLPLRVAPFESTANHSMAKYTPSHSIVMFGPPSPHSLTVVALFKRSLPCRITAATAVQAC